MSDLMGESVPTSREVVPGGSVPTSHDGGVGAGLDGLGGGGSWSPLPPSLRDRFVYRSVLAKRASEASLFLVDDVGLGSVALLKLYNSGVNLKADALEVLAGLPEEHVVRLFAFGVVEEPGNTP